MVPEYSALILTSLSRKWIMKLTQVWIGFVDLNDTTCKKLCRLLVLASSSNKKLYYWNNGVLWNHLGQTNSSSDIVW